MRKPRGQPITTAEKIARNERLSRAAKKGWDNRKRALHGKQAKAKLDQTDRP